MTWTAKNANLTKLSVKERRNLLPPQLISLFQKMNSLDMDVKKVWLFGSRSRGDARENSDFDLAFQLGSRKNWSRFVTDVAEDPPSLHRYDLVDFENADEVLQKEVLKEGIVIYESEQK
jgi:uncharacterized protein